MHDVCAPISLAVRDPAAPTDLQRAGIDGALALWRDRGIGMVSLVDAGTAGPDAIALRFQLAALPFHGLYDDETDTVYINSSLVDPSPLAITIAHELGHSFGLLHVPASERRSLMNPGNLVTPPTDADLAAIQALWGRCDDQPR